MDTPTQLKPQPFIKKIKEYILEKVIGKVQQFSTKKPIFLGFLCNCLFSKK